MSVVQEAGENLRRVPFLVALVLIVVAVLVELGNTELLQGPSRSGGDASQRILSSPAFRDATSDMDDGDRDDAVDRIRAAIESDDSPPGMGIRYLALVDVILVFTTLMIALSLIVPEHVHGKLQGIVTLIFSFLLVLGALLLTIVAFVLLIVMVSLFFAPPFGTIAYLAVWGWFNTWAAAAVLGVVMLLKLGYAGCLVVAHQRFLENKGLVLLVLTSLVCNVIIGFLHGIVPFVMVSITDAIAAIIFGIVAIIWGIVLLIGAIIAIVQAILTR
jgi:hypothetical protein